MAKRVRTFALLSDVVSFLARPFGVHRKEMALLYDLKLHLIRLGREEGVWRKWLWRAEECEKTRVQ